MKNSSISPISFDDIVNNFAVIIPFESRDLLYLYSNRKDGLKLFAFYKNSMTSKGYMNYFARTNSISILSNLLPKQNDSYFYYFDSKFVSDLSRGNDNRDSKIIFLWETNYPLSQQDYNEIHEIFLKFENSFIKNIDYILLSQYKLGEFEENSKYTDIRIKHKEIYEKDIEGVKRELEEFFSILFFKINHIDLKNRNRINFRKKYFLFMAFIYLILISVMMFYILISNLRPYFNF